MPRIMTMEELSGRGRTPDEPGARLQVVAFETARAALSAGRPVLVQVPRAGYLPWLACGACRESARCRHCAGPLALAGQPEGRGPAGGTTGDPAGLPRCRWCGRPEGGFRCRACGSRRLRAGVIGSGRTAEELGRAFPGTPVRSSGGGAPVLAEVPAGAALVVATPGAEPAVAEATGGAGYGAALLLDGWALLSRPDLRVAEETLRRWLGAAALVVPHGSGGRVVVSADPALPVVQALLRWDPAWHAGIELAGRAEVGFPPAVRMAAVEGGARAVAEVLAALPPDVEVLGPVELDSPDDPRRDDRADADANAAGDNAGDNADTGPRERALLRVPRARGKVLSAALHAAQAARSTRKATDPVRIRLDPAEIG
jgi:primosomal protein N' (replication factor Y)